MKELYEKCYQINQVAVQTPTEKVCKLCEETGEVAQVINKNRTHSKYTKEELKHKVTEECSDVLLVIFSLMNMYDISYDEVLEMANFKSIKWERVYKNKKGL